MSRTAPTEAVVFDLDGTLVDSLPLVLQAISYAIEPFGPLRPTMEIFARLGGPPERFMPGLLNDPRDTPAALARAYSPPETTSIPAPSCARTFSSATLLAAFIA